MDEQRFKQALEHLQALVRFDTTNPPGNETPAARYLQEVLSGTGVESELIEPRPGRGNLVARLRGDGSGKPLLLLGHLDVVGADPARWSVPPFAGEIRDGYLYGRGALDMKSMVVMSLMTMLELKRRGAKLKRDLILAAVADEEAGGQWGAGYLVDNRPELLRAEYALCEFGGFCLEIKGRRYYPVQVAERGCAWCRVIYRGQPGHGSIPNPHSSVMKLVRALSRLGKRGLPLKVTEPVRCFIEAVSADLKLPARLGMRALANPWSAPLVLKTLPAEQARPFYAQLHSTAVPTVLRAGEKENVIPEMAEAIIDGRVLPGESWETFREQLLQALGGQAEVELLRWSPPLVYPAHTPLFQTIARVVERRQPDARVVPYMLTAFTDAKHLDRLGVITYGFSPLGNRPNEKISELIHGEDERVGLEAFRWGLEVLLEVVEKFCTGEDATAAARLFEQLQVGDGGA